MDYQFDGNILTINHIPTSIQTVEDFLYTFLQSKKNRYLLIKDKQLFIDNKPITDIHTTLDTHTISISIPDQDIDWKCADRSCPVIYEDDFVYIAHKEAGIIIHGEEDDTTCLMAQAAHYQQEHAIYTPVRPIHRLDRDTQGLVLFSKIPFFQPLLDHQLSNKLIQRSYIAICKGKIPKKKEMVIDSPIGKDRHRNGVYRVSKSGQSAKTIVKFLKEENGFIYFLCTLQTGRTHQIRVHLSSIGYPIINDSLYGIKDPTYKNMGLYAFQLQLKQPITNKEITVIDSHTKDLGGFLYEV